MFWIEGNGHFWDFCSSYVSLCSKKFSVQCGKTAKSINLNNGKKWDISYLPTALVQGQGGQHAQQWHEIGGGCHRHFTPSLQTSRAQTGKRILIHLLFFFAYCLPCLHLSTENAALLMKQHQLYFQAWVHEMNYVSFYKKFL